jgi:GMP reductase
MIEIKIDFNDILIVPEVHSDIESRYKDIKLPDVLPLFTAPMDTVVNTNNMNIFLNNKINVCLPRTISFKEFLKTNSDYYHNDNTFQGIFISMGFDDIEKEFYTNEFQNYHENAHILIDVANGHLQKVVDYAKKIKLHRPDIKIMIGNVANPETYHWYARNDCVDYIRISIGSGNGCLTSVNSGVGYPMASLIHETYLVKEDYLANNPDKNVPAIVADGGMKNYSDIIKALNLGADHIMLGSIFNKAIESSAPNYLYGIKINNDLANYFFDKGFPVKKYFRGMSTKGAQKAMGKISLKTSEGVERYRNVEYHLNGWVENFEHYLRTAMSYSDCKTLDEFIGKANFIHITENAYNRFNK